MAENLLTTSLHTSRKKAEQLSDLYAQRRPGLLLSMKGNNDIARQIENLEAIEASYYAMAGARDYKEFKQKLEECISTEASFGLAQLGGAQLRKNLQILKNQHSADNVEVENEVELIVDVYGIAGANKGINEALSSLKGIGKTTRLKGGKVKINLGLNPRSFKEVLNIVATLENKEGKKKRGRKYTIDDHLSSALYSKLSDYEVDGKILLANGIGAEKDQKGVIAEKLRISENFLGYPWNFNKHDIETAIEAGNESYFHETLIKALHTIQDWLLLIAGTTPELKRAIIEEWNKVVGDEYSDLTNAKFFLKGGYIDLVVGALGEFQTAVFQNLLSQYFPGMKAKFSASISGNVFAEGTSEQAKADVLFGTLGIQVKNYASPSRPIEGNIHPYELRKYYNDEVLYDSGLFGMLANRHWINFDGVGLDEIAQDLENALSAILNFNSLDVGLDDKISFYMISGAYLVPASVILREFSTIREDQRVIIDSKQTPQDETAIDHHQYWTHNGNGWEKTEANTKRFENLLKRNITLRANFKYNRIPDLSLYKLI